MATHTSPRILTEPPHVPQAGEVERLRAEISQLEAKLDEAQRRGWFARSGSALLNGLIKLGARAYAGPPLAKAFQEAWDGTERAFRDERIEWKDLGPKLRDLLAALIGRWLKISFVWVVAALGPSVLVGVQVWLVYRQNQVMEQQSVLLAKQNEQIAAQNDQMTRQTEISADQGVQLREQIRIAFLDTTYGFRARLCEPNMPASTVVASIEGLGLDGPKLVASGLLPLIDDTEIKVALPSLEALARLLASERVGRDVSVALGERDSSIRTLIQVLHPQWSSVGPVTTAAAQALVQDLQRGRFRLLTGRALERCADLVVPQLIEVARVASDSGSTETRTAALQSLSGVQRERDAAREALLEHLDYGLADNAVTSILGRLGPDGSPALVKRVRDPQGQRERRIAAALALGRVGRGALESVRSLIADPSLANKWLGIHALGQLALIDQPGRATLGTELEQLSQSPAVSQDSTLRRTAASWADVLKRVATSPSFGMVAPLPNALPDEMPAN